MDNRSEVIKQFGENAEKYVHSRVHAQGGSLKRLVELVRPLPHWQVVDIAAGAGHTGLMFAPHVAHVVLSDLTPQMLEKAAALAKEKKLTNVSVEPADAEALPFSDEQFHLATCRIAPHHFPNIPEFLNEAYRVLKPAGILAVVDNIVPGSHLRGKKAELERDAGNYVNAFEKLRDPSHGRCLSIYEWQQAIKKAGFRIHHFETAKKEMDFDWWTERMNVSSKNKIRLKSMLVQAPAQVTAFLTPEFSGDRIKFYLTEGIFIGLKD